MVLEQSCSLWYETCASTKAKSKLKNQETIVTSTVSVLASLWVAGCHKHHWLESAPLLVHAVTATATYTVECESVSYHAQWENLNWIESCSFTIRARQ